ncbi:MAG: aminoglycoside phosphotransferase [Mycobacterium sp.]|nr:aminoglycoside phosphotransferase [Mycobacterium sp.]
MTILVGPIPVPEAVAGIAAGRDVVPIRVNELGGVTFRVADEFVKTATPRTGWGGRSRGPGRSAPVCASCTTRCPSMAARSNGSVPGKLAESPPLRRSGLEQPPTVDL